MERWKEIEGTAGLFWVSDHGRVKSFTKGGDGLVMSHSFTRGYPQVSLRSVKHGFAFTKTVHRLVAEAFVDKPEGKTQVNHKDLNKENNHWENLEWCTWEENIAHMIANGRRHAMTNPKRAPLLTAEKVAAMRAAYASGRTATSIAKEFGTSKTNARSVLKGKTWRMP